MEVQTKIELGKKKLRAAVRQPGRDREVTVAKINLEAARYHNNGEMQALGWKLTP